MKEREFELLDMAKSSTYGIYQVKRGDRYRHIKFESLDRIRQNNYSIDRKNYDFVYADILKGESLDTLYERFNLYHPKNFRGHSLSVSDIIVLKESGKISAHYVDSFGFKQVPEFIASLYQRIGDAIKNSESEME